MYIAPAPDCAKNRQYAEIQKAAFEAGLSAPDFAPDNFEVDFTGRFTRADLSPLGLRVMGITRPVKKSLGIGIRVRSNLAVRAF